MERRTRIWLGLGTAVLVGGGTVAGPSAPAAAGPAGLALPADHFPGLHLAQEGGEGGAGEGGGAPVGPGSRALPDYRLLSTDPKAFGYDGSAQIAAYGAVVHESYAAARAAAVAMQEAITAFLAAPNPLTLEAARSAWLAARGPYLQTEASRFYGGPIDLVLEGPEPRINAAPIDPDFIDSLVNDSAAPITRQTILSLDQAAGPAQVTTGWHAIEFLLWGEDVSATGPGARPHTDFVAGQGSNDRRRDYLRIVTQLLVNDLTNMVGAWSPGANNYRASLAAIDQRAAIGRIFNGMGVLAGFELASGRLAAAVRRGQEHSAFSDSTVAELAAGVRGIRNVYFGNASDTEGAGFDVLVAAIDPAVNERVTAALDGAEQALAALDAPFDTILGALPGSPARAAAEAAVASLRDLADALRVAGNRLGVLVLVNRG